MIRAALGQVVRQVTRHQERRAAVRSTPYMSPSELREFEAIHEEQMHGTAVAARGFDREDRERLWLRGLRLRSTRELNKTIETLGRTSLPEPGGRPVSRLLRLLATLGHDLRDWLFALALPKIEEPGAAAQMLGAYLAYAEQSRDPERQQHARAAVELIVHRTLTSKPGVFVATLRELEALLANDPERLARARESLRGHVKTLRRSLILAHRGAPMGEFPENTLEGFQQALDEGADGFETDVCVTKDGKIVLWHDARPGHDLTAYLRQLGLEPGMSYRPRAPKIFSRYRRPVHELTEEEFQRSRGYVRNDRTLVGELIDDLRRFSSRLLGMPSLRPADRPRRVYPHKIPTLEEFAVWLAEGDGHRREQVRRIVLDVKLLEDDPAIESFAGECRRVLETYGLGEAVVCTCPNEEVRKRLQAAFDDLGFASGVAAEKGIVELFPDPTKIDLSAFGSVGLPRLGVDATDAFTELVALWRLRKPEHGLGTWTLNEERLLRRVIALGVPWILTDKTVEAVAIQAEVERQYPGYLAAVAPPDSGSPLSY